MCVKIKPKSHMLTIPLYTKFKPRQLFWFPIVHILTVPYHFTWHENRHTKKWCAQGVNVDST